MNINTYPFSKSSKEVLSKEKKGQDWPVVYLINNDKEMYIGESQNITNRLEQHLDNPGRKNLTNINVIFDDEFNKSAILDIEQSLIQLCGADKKYHLQNKNTGQSCKHNYYQREKYLNKVDDIWKELKKKDLVKHNIDDIRNSNLFKYSPYNTLTLEQSEASNKIIKHALECLLKGKDGTSIISGGAGTGKTIVLINILFKFLSSEKYEVDSDKEDDEIKDYLSLMSLIQKYVHEKNGKPLKIGYICPMTSLRKTMRTVFSLTGNGLKSSLVMGPQDVFGKGEKFDILFVDESHRLTRRKNITSFGSFDECARKIGKDPKETTQLDFIVARSKYRILVYDEKQTIKGSDIRNDQFNKALEGSNINKVTLFSQMRCKGGEEFTSYLDKIFDCSQESFEEFDPTLYEFKLFNDANEMIEKIKKLDKTYGLCRNAAGYSWEWISKPYLKKGYQYIIDNGFQDIEISGHKYVWNMTNEEFILSKNAVNEIGCIHTLQGYDLNYVGVILGKEIDYDPIKKQIAIDRNKFFDSKVKAGIDDITLKRYIINSYKVMMSRGIKGCYVYACNKNLQEYLERFIGK